MGQVSGEETARKTGQRIDIIANAIFLVLGLRNGQVHYVPVGYVWTCEGPLYIDGSVRGSQWLKGGK